METFSAQFFLFKNNLKTVLSVYFHILNSINYKKKKTKYLVSEFAKLENGNDRVRVMDLS